MSSNRGSFALGFLAGAIFILTVICGIGTYLYFKGKAFEGVDGDTRSQLLQERLREKEVEFGVRCNELRERLVRMIAADIDPLLNAYAGGADWRAKLSKDLTEKLRGVHEVGMRCSELNSQMQEASRSALGDEALADVSLIMSLVRYGLVSDKCDDQCIKGQFSLLKQARDRVTGNLKKKS